MRPRIKWANVASWNTDQNTEAHIYQEIARIMAVSMSNAQVEVTPKPNEKAISHFRLKTARTRRNISIILSIGNKFLFDLQDYKSRDGSGGNRIYVCPFDNRCGCPVRFRVVKLNNEIRLQSYGKHDAESHSVDSSRQGLDLQQRASIERIARANPTSSATQVRRNLATQEKAVYVSPSKHRQVQRVVKRVREIVFEKFTPTITTGQKVNGPDSSRLWRGPAAGVAPCH